MRDARAQKAPRLGAPICINEKTQSKMIHIRPKRKGVQLDTFTLNTVRLALYTTLSRSLSVPVCVALHSSPGTCNHRVSHTMLRGCCGDKYLGDAFVFMRAWPLLRAKCEGAAHTHCTQAVAAARNSYPTFCMAGRCNMKKWTHT
jgi:hypothetical protein